MPTNKSLEAGANLNGLGVAFWVDVTVTAALLDSAGSIVVAEGKQNVQYKVRDVTLVGGGTNFGSGGDRLVSLTDGTTIYTSVPNANIETAPTVSKKLGSTEVPLLTGTIDTKTVEGSALVFKYTGGTTDHSATGSIKFSVLVQEYAA